MPGAVIPSPYGGKQRQIMINLDQRLMQAKGISPSDVLGALTAQSAVLPSGTAKIGQSEYDILNNVAPRTIEELNNVPIKQVDGAMIYVRDVATVADGFQVQTNIVRQDGHRGVLISILKAGNASTLNVVKGVRAMLPFISTIVPSQLRMTPLSDQSIFVRGAVTGVIRETVIAAALTGTHDPALPRKLAKHDHHRHFDSIVDSQLGDHSELAGRDDQHHDARRPGFGRWHPGRRCHGYD